VGNVVVARCTAPKRCNKIIWKHWGCLLCSILASIISTMKNLKCLALIIIAISIVCSCTTSPIKRKNETEAVIQNDLPDLIINFLDGSQIHAKELQGNTIIVVFFPDCDHCQREATQIKKNIEQFKNYTLYFLATTPKEEIETFAIDYKLGNEKNVQFGMIAAQDVLPNFGSIPTPSLYIYNSDHRLVQTFNGETDIETILKYIK
jgi:hypothetical protein